MKSTTVIGVMIGAVLLAGAMFLAGRVSAPDEQVTKDVTRIADATDVIDESLMMSLAQAKNFHRKAKVYMSDGKLDEAAAAVRQILSLSFPKGAPEADDVRLDARALLAKLLVLQGKLDEAMRTVDEGLASSQRESFFTANLYTVRGEILEARAMNYDAEGEASKGLAAAARRSAIEAYDKSIQINEKLQKQLMENR
jgi:tetratricopeptide (TPR) repeat protein